MYCAACDWPCSQHVPRFFNCFVHEVGMRVRVYVLCMCVCVCKCLRPCVLSIEWRGPHYEFCKRSTSVGSVILKQIISKYNIHISIIMKV